VLNDIVHDRLSHSQSVIHSLPVRHRHRSRYCLTRYLFANADTDLLTVSHPICSPVQTQIQLPPHVPFRENHQCITRSPGTLWLAGNEQAAVHKVFYTFPFRPSSSHHFRGTHSILQNGQCVAAQVLKNKTMFLRWSTGMTTGYGTKDMICLLFCFVLFAVIW